jgi:flagellar basal-body rod protein FlgB
MNEGMEAITTKALSLALDAASMRQQAIASNIANANTPGYAPIAVNFSSQLDEARRTLSSKGKLDAESLEGVRPSLELATGPGGLPAKLMLDVEAANLAQNSVHFQALLKGLKSHYQILSAATSDGKK